MQYAPANPTKLLSIAQSIPSGQGFASLHRSTQSPSGPSTVWTGSQLDVLPSISAHGSP